MPIKLESLHPSFQAFLKIANGRSYKFSESLLIRMLSKFPDQKIVLAKLSSLQHTKIPPKTVGLSRETLQNVDGENFEKAFRKVHSSHHDDFIQYLYENSETQLNRIDAITQQLQKQSNSVVLGLSLFSSRQVDNKPTQEQKSDNLAAVDAAAEESVFENIYSRAAAILWDRFKSKAMSFNSKLSVDQGIPADHPLQKVMEAIDYPKDKSALKKKIESVLSDLYNGLVEINLRASEHFELLQPNYVFSTNSKSSGNQERYEALLRDYILEKQALMAAVVDKKKRPKVSSSFAFIDDWIGLQDDWIWATEKMWDAFVNCKLKLPVRKGEEDPVVQQIYKDSRLPSSFKQHLYALRAFFQQLGYEVGLVLDPISAEDDPPKSFLVDSWQRTTIGQKCIRDYCDQVRELTTDIFSSFIKQEAPTQRKYPEYGGKEKLYPAVTRRASVLENRLQREWPMMNTALTRAFTRGQLQLRSDPEVDLKRFDNEEVLSRNKPFHPVSKLFLQEALRILKETVDCLYETGDVKKIYDQYRKDFVRWVDGKYPGQRLITSWIDDFYGRIIEEMVAEYQNEFSRYGEDAWYDRLSSNSTFSHTFDVKTRKSDGVKQLLRIFDFRLKEAWESYKSAYAKKGIKADKPRIPLLAKLVDELAQHLKSVEEAFVAGAPLPANRRRPVIEQWVIDYDRQLREPFAGIQPALDDHLRNGVPLPDQSQFSSIMVRRVEMYLETKRKLFAPYKKEINSLFKNTSTPQIPVTLFVTDPYLNDMAQQYAKRLSEQVALCQQIINVGDHIEGFSVSKIKGIEPAVIAKVAGKRSREDMDDSDDEQKETAFEIRVPVDLDITEAEEAKENESALFSEPVSKKAAVNVKNDREPVRLRDAGGQPHAKSHRLIGSDKPRGSREKLPGTANDERMPKGCSMWSIPLSPQFIKSPVLPQRTGSNNSSNKRGPSRR